jgi:3-oxoacyl-[acyl-carrier protein] reductase
VRSASDCRRLVDQTIARFGRLDVLVNNAGIGAFVPVAEMQPEAWDDVIGTNLDGVFYCCHAAIPALREAGESWVINIGSLAGKNAFPGGAAYNASKFGLIGFSEALMQEVRHDGIRVSYIMPGSVATEFTHPRAGTDEWKIQPQDVAQIVLDLLDTPARTLPSRVEVRPSRPPRKG